MNLGRGHSPALLGTFPASHGAFPAMVVMAMLLAFSRALVADLRADQAYFLGFIAPEAHHFGRGIADSRALHIGLNTSGHHLNVFLHRASGSTMVTRGRAKKTRIDARGVVVVDCCSHIVLVFYMIAKRVIAEVAITRDFNLESVHLAVEPVPDFVFGSSCSCLDSSKQLVFFSFFIQKVVVRQIGPFLLGTSFQFVPISFKS